MLIMKLMIIFILFKAAVKQSPQLWASLSVEQLNNEWVIIMFSVLHVSFLKHIFNVKSANGKVGKMQSSFLEMEISTLICG